VLSVDFAAINGENRSFVFHGVCELAGGGLIENSLRSMVVLAK
jgi:hypothetical protein